MNDCHAKSRLCIHAECDAVAAPDRRSDAVRRRRWEVRFDFRARLPATRGDQLIHEFMTEHGDQDHVSDGVDTHQAIPLLWGTAQPIVPRKQAGRPVGCDVTESSQATGRRPAPSNVHLAGSTPDEGTLTRTSSSVPAVAVRHQTPQYQPCTSGVPVTHLRPTAGGTLRSWSPWSGCAYPASGRRTRPRRGGPPHAGSPGQRSRCTRRPPGPRTGRGTRR